jgi:hypothetical protein
MVFNFLSFSIIEPVKKTWLGNNLKRLSLIDRFLIFCKALEEGEFKNDTIIHINSSNF